MDNCTQHVRDIRGKESNKRLYIGPGRDGSSDDKISVDVKFDSRTTKITENKFLRAQGYVKTSFAFERDEETQTDSWRVIEDQVELDNEQLFSDPVDQMVIIIHPMFSTAEDDAKKAASSTTAPAQAGTEAVANLAIDNSPPIDDSPIDEEADYAIDPADI